MCDKVVCASRDEGKILIADILCKIVFSVEIDNSDISHIGRPMRERPELLYPEIALTSILYLTDRK
jgi:hypothetical protein